MKVEFIEEFEELEEMEEIVTPIFGILICCW